MFYRAVFLKIRPEVFHLSGRLKPTVRVFVHFGADDKVGIQLIHIEH